VGGFCRFTDRRDIHGVILENLITAAYRPVMP
jgi:hypothetical protein